MTCQSHWAISTPFSTTDSVSEAGWKELREKMRQRHVSTCESWPDGTLGNTRYIENDAIFGRSAEWFTEIIDCDWLHCGGTP